MAVRSPQTPWDPKKELPQAAALVYFLIGMCHSELGKPASALEAFNSAIKVNPEYAEVRGAATAFTLKL